jgi:putative aldouronate transport system substrate-binding protein
MNARKTSLYLLWAMVLVVGLLASACGASTPATNAPVATKPAVVPTQVPTAEPVPVTVKYTYMVASVSDKTPAVEQAVNDLIHLEYPWLSVALNPITQAEYAEKISLLFSSGEACDIVYTPKWLAGIYSQRVANGDLMQLDDLLLTVPELTSVIPEVEWTGTMVNNKTYAIPGNQLNVAVSGISIMMPMLEKYPLDWDQINKIEDIEPWIATVKAGEPDLLGFTYLDNWFRPDIFGYDTIDSGLGGSTFSNPGILGVKYNDTSRTVVNYLESSEFSDFLARTRRWVEKSYLPAEPDPEVFPHLIAMRYIAQMNYAQPHDWWAASYGIPALYGKALAPAFYANFRTGQNSTGICATSKQSEAAIKFLALLNTNPAIYNTMLYGVENQDWLWVDQEKRQITRPEGYDDYTGYAGIDWVLGNSFLAYYKNPDWASHDIWTMEQDLNASAKPSVMLGFSFDRTPVMTEIAQVTAVLDEKATSLVYGWEKDWQSKLVELNTALNQAGIGIIQAEMQRQINQWASSQ